MDSRRRSTHGFTLVEMSIVLVIIGLLVGGVLSGQSLIRAAELRAVSSEFMKYSAAVNAFKDKYMAIPGDMNNATQFWGFAGTTAAPGCVSNSGITAVTANGTCDGNGDGQVSAAAAASTTGEMFQFWRQQALAGIIEGSYTGLAGAGSGQECDIGINEPKSKVQNAGWSVLNLSNYGGDAAIYAYDYGNMFIFGAPNGTLTTYAPVLKPEEAWSIDTKLDDGKPNSGKVIASEYTLCTTTVAGGASAKGDPNTDIYKLSDTGIDCGLLFAKAF